MKTKKHYLKVLTLVIFLSGLFLLGASGAKAGNITPSVSCASPYTVAGWASSGQTLPSWGAGACGLSGTDVFNVTTSGDTITIGGYYPLKVKVPGCTFSGSGSTNTGGTGGTGGYNLFCVSAFGNSINIGGVSVGVSGCFASGSGCMPILFNTGWPQGPDFGVEGDSLLLFGHSYFGTWMTPPVEKRGNITFTDNVTPATPSCSRTTTQAPTPRVSCPNGGVLSGNTCTYTGKWSNGTTTVNQPICPSGPAALNPLTGTLTCSYTDNSAFLCNNVCSSTYSNTLMKAFVASDSTCTTPIGFVEYALNCACGAKTLPSSTLGINDSSCTSCPAINGACGSSNGQTLSVAPTANLCSDGTTPTVTGTGPWNWTCAGLFAGTNASCSANKTCVANGTYHGYSCTSDALNCNDPANCGRNNYSTCTALDSCNASASLTPSACTAALGTTCAPTATVCPPCASAANGAWKEVAP